MTYTRFLRMAIAAGLALLGCGLIFSNFAATPEWVQRHFLPDFSMSPTGRLAREALARLVVAGFGVTLILLARSVSRLTTKVEAVNLAGAVGRISLAVVLALATGEVLLRTVFWRTFDELRPDREPLRQYDARRGWDHVPDRIGRAEVGGRAVTYVVNALGDRVAALDARLDTELPTILLAGESFLFGFKLPWEETVAAQVMALTGVQTANLAIEGYSNAQAYMRLAAEMPRFKRPVAVVSIFVPSVFRKSLDRTRPQVDAALNWIPPERPLRLQVLARYLVPYRSVDEIAAGVASTRAVLRATEALARVRGAVPVTIVPQVVPENPAEAELRRRVFDDAGLPYVLVPFPAAWRIPGDGHPDVRATRLMAEAIAGALRQQHVLGGTALQPP